VLTIAIPRSVSDAYLMPAFLDWRIIRSMEVPKVVLLARQRLPDDTWPEALIGDIDRQGVSQEVVSTMSLRRGNNVAADLEFGGIIVGDLTAPTPDTSPFQGRRGTGFPTQNLGKLIAETDP